MVKLAYKVFGRERLEANLAPIVGVNEQWEYSQGGRVAALRSLVAEVLPLPHRRDMRLDLLRLGRWVAQHHPEVLTPADFTRELAAEVVAAVNQMTIGEFSCENLNVPLKHPGQPWSAVPLPLADGNDLLEQAQRWPAATRHSLDRRIIPSVSVNGTAASASFFQNSAWSSELAVAMIMRIGAETSPR